jgi:hypothetical protein
MRSGAMNLPAGLKRYAWGNEACSADVRYLGELAQWRYGVLPALARRSNGATEIVLDDADDPRADAMLRRWQQEFGTSHYLRRSADGAYAVISCRL